jgi:hypothetical protein
MRRDRRALTKVLPLLLATALPVTGAVACGGAEPSTGTPTPAGPASTAASTAPAPGISASSGLPARDPHTLVFTAEGTATVDSLTYVVDGETVRERSVSLPWRKSLTVPADGRVREWRLTARIRGGDVALVAYLDGRVSTRSMAGGTGTGTASLAGSIRS